MPLSFGQAKGLAQSLEYDARIKDLQYVNEYERRAKAEAIARAQTEAKDMEYTHASNPFDEQKVKDNFNVIASEVGKYKMENPDWQWNTQKRAFINGKLSELRNNDALLRSVQFKDAYNQYLADRQEAMKNPQSWDMELLDAEGKKFDNYIKTGHYDGEAGYQRDKSYKAPVYTRPQALVDVVPYLQQIGKNTNDFDVKKGDNIGEVWNEMKPEQLEKLTDAAYAQQKRSIEIEARKRGLTDPADVRNMVKTLINSGFDKKYQIGDANALWERNFRMMDYNMRKKAMEPNVVQQDNYGSWSYITDSRTKAGQVDAETVAKVIGTNPLTPVYDNQGKSISVSDYEWKPNGRFANHKGVTYFYGDVEMPLAEAASKGIVKDYESGDESADSPSALLSGDWKGKAAIYTRYKDGKPSRAVKVTYLMPVNKNNPSLQQKWESLVQPDKTVAPVKNPYGGQARQIPPGAMQDEAGNLFDSSGKYIGKLSDFQ